MKHIILVEDDKFLVKVYRLKFEKTGYNAEIIVHDDILTSSDIIRSKRPDLVILDIVMPGKDGFEILKELQADAETKSIPVIILTNLTQDADREVGLKLGAKEYISKSDVTFDEILETAKKYLHA